MDNGQLIINRIVAALADLYDPHEARSIALLTLAELSGISTSKLLSDPSQPLAIENLEDVIAELANARPVQYVLGYKEFYGHRFAVREGVLIPRPETEELVAWVVQNETKNSRILDVGTGSGCIAASLALALPDAQVYATDISDTALAIAAENFRTLGAQVVLRKADALSNLTERFPERFDAIVSNPPYIPASDRATMHRNVLDYEPAQALFVPDNDPLRFYRAIARAGRQMLIPNGRLYFEIYEQAVDAMREMLAQEGYTQTEIHRDLNGKPRMLCSRKS